MNNCYLLFVFANYSTETLDKISTSSGHEDLMMKKDYILN